jgi:ankyrin repeat protein
MPGTTKKSESKAKKVSKKQSAVKAREPSSLSARRAVSAAKGASASKASAKTSDPPFPIDAISEGRLKDVTRYLAAGGDINARCRGYMGTLLTDAVQSGNVKLVKDLIAKGANPNVADALQISPLQRAAELALEEIVRVLLQHGADPNYRDTAGMTPLHYAAWCDRVSGVSAWRHLPPPKKAAVIELLLRAGANAFAKDNAARIPRFFAETAVNKEGLELLPS